MQSEKYILGYETNTFWNFRQTHFEMQEIFLELNSTTQSRQWSLYSLPTVFRKSSGQEQHYDHIIELFEDQCPAT